MPPGAEVLTLSVAGRRWSMYDHGGRVARHLRRGEPYELPLLEEIRRRRPRGAALDVGAHVGNHALYLAIVCGLEVHAWEADPVRVRQLRENLELNAERFRVLPDRVVVYPYAAGAEDGRGRWREGRYNQLVLGEGPLEVRRPDDHPVRDLSLVKIDVEGHEPEVLRGLEEHLRRWRPLVYAEAHDGEAHDRQAEVLEPLGYRMTERSRPANAPMERWEP